jgi:hypothetical protein
MENSAQLSRSLGRQAAQMTESEIRAELELDLHRLGDRCIWRAEVWMICWTHSLRDQADRLRIDYVAELDGRLVGIEAKAPAAKCSDLGRDLLQCVQYAAGKIGVNRAEVPNHWIGQPLAGVFLRTKSARQDPRFLEHARASHRLYGPANVGYVTRECYNGLVLRLCSERFGTERRGYHQGMLVKSHRVGNSTVRVVG